MHRKDSVPPGGSLAELDPVQPVIDDSGNPDLRDRNTHLLLTAWKDLLESRKRARPAVVIDPHRR